MSRALRKRNAHPSVHGQDGADLLAQLRAERDVPRCGVCECPMENPAPLCRGCDAVLNQELRGHRGGRRG